MRTLDEHKINPTNDRIGIVVTDVPGAGGANHRYVINGFAASRNASSVEDDLDACFILFQNGPIAEVGINGITQEALLAIVIDRLRSFQAGDYACKENACALTHIEEALHWLQQRTIKRMRRGVEGTNVI